MSIELAPQTINTQNQNNIQKDQLSPREAAIKRLTYVLLYAFKESSKVDINQIFEDRGGKVTNREKTVAIIRARHKIGCDIQVFNKKNQLVAIPETISEVERYISNDAFNLVLVPKPAEIIKPSGEFITETRSRDNQKIIWEGKAIIEKSFIMPDPNEGNRAFVVVELRGKAENGKQFSIAQPFYKSTGRNSGFKDKWFPCRGVNAQGLNPHIVKMQSTQGPERVSIKENGQTYFVSNPQRRMGSMDTIYAYGNLFDKVSNLLSKISIEPQKLVPYEEVNSELKNITPNVDLRFEPGAKISI